MFQFKTVEALKTYLSKQRSEGKTIGFVPTMGALHEGHISLIDASKAATDITVCSIFVNPTQFNVSEDLEKYPRTLHEDIEKLAAADCEVLFAPSVHEMYPNGMEKTRTFDFGAIGAVMEGEKRPGHFDGVAQVVHRLLEIVEPTSLFMGQKDFQQTAIIRSMLAQLKWSTELVVCPIMRESTGLAMSSRNTRLSDKGRLQASYIYKILEQVRHDFNADRVHILESKAILALQTAGFEPEYFTIANAKTLQPLQPGETADEIVICTAAWLEGVRLIDNSLIP